ncbi:MAG: serine hydrolase, partial [Verrucomicrobia bacterium]|nr:serine hydrolase [Verrucomicrobiota bacterium]
CQLLLNRGTFGGRRLLSEAAVRYLTAIHTGDLPTGFFQGESYGHRGRNYGWGIGTCVLRMPHEGAAEVLAPGSFGHGGAWGTQAWIDPANGIAYVLMVQRANFPNSDASEVRRSFQAAASAALARQR